MSDLTHRFRLIIPSGRAAFAIRSDLFFCLLHREGYRVGCDLLAVLVRDDATVLVAVPACRAGQCQCGGVAARRPCHYLFNPNAAKEIIDSSSGIIFWENVNTK